MPRTASSRAGIRRQGLAVAGGFTDNFNRADGPLTSPWLSDGGGGSFRVSSNRLQATAPSVGSFASVLATAPSGDMEIAVDNFRPDTSGSSTIFIASSNAGGSTTPGADSYYWQFDSSATYGALYRQHAGATALVTTELDSTVWTGGTARLRLTRVGNRIRVYVNGTLRFDVIDSAPLPTTGLYGGVSANGSSSEYFDNVYIGPTLP